MLLQKEIFLPEKYLKVWGYELWVANKPKYCGKLLHFNEGKRCSLHYHILKDETFFLARGKLRVSLADSPEAYGRGEIQEVTLGPGECLYIWPGRVHQMRALEESELIEISTQHFEDDSIRIERGD